MDSGTRVEANKIMPIIKMPDGKRIKFPDSMSDAEIEGILSKQISGATMTPTPDLQPPRGGAGGAFPYQPTLEYPDTTDFVAKSMGGGMLRIGESLAALPFDVVGAFGSEGSKKIASQIRENFPSIPSTTTAEEIAQTVVQYGVPTGTAMKLMGKALGGAPAAVKWLGEITAGGFSDFLVADPEEKTVGIVPSKVGDSVLMRKAKIGAEGAIIPAGLQTVGKVGKGAIRFVQMFTPGVLARKAVKGALRDTVQDVDSAIKEIDRALWRYSDTGYKPTTGEASKDLGLIGLGKGVASKNEFSAEFLQRKELNLRAITEQLENVVKRQGGDPDKARLFFSKYMEGAFEGAENNVQYAENAIKRIEQETDEMIRNVTQGGYKQADASLYLDDIIHSRLDSLTNQKNALFGAIDPNHEVAISKERIAEAVKQATRRRGPLDTVPDALPKNIMSRLRKAISPKNKAPLTYGDLWQVRKPLSDAISKARAEDQGAIVGRLVGLKNSLDKETEYLAIEGGPAAARAQEALSFYKNEYVPRFKQHIGDAYRRAIRANKPWPGTVVGRKFLYPGGGVTESAQQLKRILFGYQNPQQAMSLVKDHIMSDVADMMVNKEGQIALNRLDRYLQNRNIRELLKQFPDVQKDLYDLRYKVKNNLGIQANLRFTKAKSEKELKRSAARFFVTNDPEKAIGSVLVSSDPDNNMRQLVKLAKQDKTGDAIKGLRVALSNYIDETVRVPRPEAGLDVSLAKMSNLLETKRTRKAISQIYSPQEISQLDRVVEMLRRVDNINKQVTAGSPTAPIQEALNRARVVLAATYGIVKGKGIFAISGWMAKILGLDPVQKANMLLRDTMIDPELAKTMLMEIKKETKPIIEKRILTYLANNFTELKPQKPQMPDQDR